MQIGVVLPADRDRWRRRRGARLRRARRGARLRAHPRLRPRVGADPEVHTPWRGPYDIDTTFHEPFVLFGYLAAITVARARHRHHHPAAAPDRARGQAGGRGRPADRRPLPARRRPRLERGRVRGARQGASPTAGAASRSRSSCCAGCGPSRRVTFDGELRHGHRRRARAAAGAAADPDLDRRLVAGARYRRAGRLADGWFPQVLPGPELDEARADRRRRRRGRRARSRPRSAWRVGSRWAEGGVDDGRRPRRAVARDRAPRHLSINTMGAGLGAVDDHLDALTEVAGALSLAS